MNRLRLNALHRRGLLASCFAMLLCPAAALSADPPTPGTADEPQKWTTLLGGSSKSQWQPVTHAVFNRGGEASVTEEMLVLKQGHPGTGVRWTGSFPDQDYELTLEGRRTEGDDFFCGLTFPVGESHLTLILGGWGGWVIGLSCIDDAYAIDNETCTSVPFENGRWYRVRLRVTRSRVQVWVDEEPTIDFDTEGHRLAASVEMQACQPLGIATWNTAGEVRDIRYRPLSR